jgi:hypothetical protein
MLSFSRGLKRINFTEGSKFFSCTRRQKISISQKKNKQIYIKKIRQVKRKKGGSSEKKIKGGTK